MSVIRDLRDAGVLNEDNRLSVLEIGDIERPLTMQQSLGLDHPGWFTLMRRTDSTRTARIVGAILAMIWLCGGVAGLIAGVVTRQWLPGVAGLMAVWYGVIWIFVARLGRRLTSREALAPWRLARRSGPGT